MSKELIETINGYENYIAINGITEEVIEAYVLAAETAINQEKDLEYGFKVTARAKELIETFVLNATGGSVWDLEKYAFANKTWSVIRVNGDGTIRIISHEGINSAFSL